MKKLLIAVLLMISCATYSQSDSAMLANLPPLPKIDTTEVPADALTTEIRKMLSRTDIMSGALQGLKSLMDVQRKTSNASIPPEFFDRFQLYVQNGRLARLFENMIIKVYRDKFTLNEVREINKFYDTPVGRKLAAETVNIMNTSRMEGEKLGQYIGLETARDLIKEGKWK